MSQVNVIRAWKDEEYRNSLSDAERAALPENPAGLAEVAETDLVQVVGGIRLITLYIGCTSVICPTGLCLPWL
jgi:mersacidin/lichenicidin family type 2 lantibiotic